MESYIRLRTALHLFKTPPANLNDNQRQQVEKQARHEWQIEESVLKSNEAIGVLISDVEIEHAYQEIRQRYDDENVFLTELAKNDLDETQLRLALARQCKVNTVLDKVGSRAEIVSDLDIELYYRLHQDKFHLPERRTVSHIFISINPDYPENTRLEALKRANDIHAKLHKKPFKFAELALKHSECPTALQGGDLGTVPRGKLYPELDAMLFKMKQGSISPVIESEIGWHILLCKQIHKAENLSLAKVAPKIRTLIQDRSKQEWIRAWLANL